MSCIVFYEKPGCATNNLQKQLLRSTGLEIEVRNLFREPWTRERLRPFFGNRPVAEWFNRSAPAIKYGDLDPSRLGGAEALELMLANPLLIRRPLIRCGQQFMAGFDLQAIKALLPCKAKLALMPAAIDSCSLGRHSQVGCLPLQAAL